MITSILILVKYYLIYYKPDTNVTVVCVAVFTLTLIGLVLLPVTFPQATVCTANKQLLPLVGTSVQVAAVRLVVVGQLPQFDARML